MLTASLLASAWVMVVRYTPALAQMVSPECSTPRVYSSGVPLEDFTARRSGCAAVHGIDFHNRRLSGHGYHLDRASRWPTWWFSMHWPARWPQLQRHVLDAVFLLGDVSHPVQGGVGVAVE